MQHIILSSKLDVSEGHLLSLIRTASTLALLSRQMQG